MKPGWRTSEFWLNVFAVGAPVVLKGFGVDAANPWAMLAAAAYTLARSYVKVNAPPSPPATVVQVMPLPPKDSA